MKMKRDMVCILAIAMFAGVAQADVTSGLIGHWDMDEGSGAIAYDSAGSNDGTLITPPEPQFVAGGKFGGAIDFAARGDTTQDNYVDIGDGGTLDLTGSRTISTWVKIDNWDSSGWTGIITKGDVAGNYDLIRNGNTGSVGFYVADNAFVVGSTVVNDGQWHMLTGVLDLEGDVQSMYVDGVLDASAAATLAATTTNDKPLLLNGLDDDPKGWDTARWFEGQMDEVRLYDRALTAADVLELYSVPEPATLVLFGIGSLALLRRRRA